MYTTYIMKRTQIYLDEGQDRALAKRARAAGRTKSELIREAIGEYLDERDGREDPLTRFRASLGLAFGIAPYLPPGAEYVDQTRAADERRELELRSRRDRR